MRTTILMLSALTAVICQMQAIAKSNPPELLKEVIDQEYADSDFEAPDSDTTVYVTTPERITFECDVFFNTGTAAIASCNTNGATRMVLPITLQVDGENYAITSVKDYAFYAYDDKKHPLSGIKEIVVPEGFVFLGDGCFKNSPDLVSISLPSSLKIISYLMLADCASLKEVIIPEDSQITEIQSFAFLNDAALAQFTIPASVISITMAPWKGCTSLKELKISEENYDFWVIDGVLYTPMCERLIQYPDGKDDKQYNVVYGTKLIGNAAFSRNPYIEEVNLPASVGGISHAAFMDCKSLNKVVFNSVDVWIGNKAFNGCPALNKIDLYGNVSFTDDDPDTPQNNNMGYNTFQSSTNVVLHEKLPAIVLPNSKNNVLKSVFNYASAMPYFQTAEIMRNEDYNIPSSLGKGAFAGFGNANPKPDMLRVIEAIPQKYLKYENIDSDGRIRRLYVDDKKKKDPKVLFFFGGIRGNDLIVAYFEQGDIKKIEQYITELNNSKYE